MKPINDMSEFEINKGIAEFKFNDALVCDRDDMYINRDHPDAVQVIHKKAIHGEYVDYCNNIADLWPLVVELMDKYDIEFQFNHNSCMVDFKRTGWSEILWSGDSSVNAGAKCVLAVLREKNKENT